MHQVRDELLRLDDALLFETQCRVNHVFSDDLLHPLYLIRAPEAREKCIMSVSGGPSSHYYRDIISCWQEPGFVVTVYRHEMTRSAFNGAILHEMSHIFQPSMSPPWACLPENVGLLPVPKEYYRPVFGSSYDEYKSHCPDFWRTAFHLWSRAVKAGFPCSHRDLGQTWVHPDELLETLKPEIKQFEDQPLWKIARRPVPRAFARLFDFNAEDWNDEQVVAKVLEYHLNPKEAHADQEKTAEAERQSA